MGRAEFLRGRMRDLTLAVLGRNAQKQLEQGLSISRAQAHRIIHHDHCPSHLRLALVSFLERRLDDALRRLGAAEHDLKFIRQERMVGRAESRRVEARREADPPLPGLGQGPREAGNLK